MQRSIFALLVVFFGVALFPGCGGDSGPAPGSATVNITWPTRTRLIPAASEAITLNLYNGSQLLASQLAVRPPNPGTTTYTFYKLPSTLLTLRAVAYPNADASGVVQASGTVQFTPQVGMTTTINLSLNSAIDHVAMVPAVPSLPIGAHLPLSLTAYDASGNVVLTQPEKITYQSANTNFATVTVDGILTGVAPTGATPGSVAITATDTESGKSVTANTTVTSNTVVTVSPVGAIVKVGANQAFTAQVTGTSNTAVTWKVLEAGGGTITSSGVYTPAAPGTYHVVATSVYDNSQQGTAVVSVTP